MLFSIMMKTEVFLLNIQDRARVQSKTVCFNALQSGAFDPFSKVGLQGWTIIFEFLF